MRGAARARRRAPRCRQTRARPAKRDGAASDGRCHAAANGTSNTGTRRRPRSHKISGQRQQREKPNRIFENEVASFGDQQRKESHKKAQKGAKKNQLILGVVQILRFLCFFGHGNLSDRAGAHARVQRNGRAQSRRFPRV